MAAIAVETAVVAAAAAAAAVAVADDDMDDNNVGYDNVGVNGRQQRR